MKLFIVKSFFVTGDDMGEMGSDFDPMDDELDDDLLDEMIWT